MKLNSYDNYQEKNIIPVIDNHSKLFHNTSDFCNMLNITTSELIFLQKQFTRLRTRGQIIDNVTFSDLDDTLLSRVPQLEEDKFANARGHQGNEVVKAMGLKKFIDKYYSPELVVKEIIEKTNFILTAGEVENQEAKIQKSDLFQFDTMIVPDHSLKPKELLYFLLFKLKKIPQTITINDDNVDKLEDQLSVISEFLNNTIICNKVELDKDFPSLVKSIDTTIYTSGEDFKKAA